LSLWRFFDGVASAIHRLSGPGSVLGVGDRRGCVWGWAAKGGDGGKQEGWKERVSHKNQR
jgi:hypothetical protein